MTASFIKTIFFVFWCSLISRVSGQHAADWMSGNHGVGFRLPGGVNIETAWYDVDALVQQIKDEIPDITWILLGISSGAYGDRYLSPHSILTSLNRGSTPILTENVPGKDNWQIINANGLIDFNFTGYPDRDLYSEISNALHAAGYKVIAYMAAQGPSFLKHGETRAYDYNNKSVYVNSVTDCNELTAGSITDGKCSPSARRWRNKVIGIYGNDTDSTLQLAYAELILREYANKFDGKEGRALVDGWWFDQGKFMDVPLAHEIIMEANPNAIIAFNKGTKIPLMNNNPPYEDFTFGHPNPIKNTLPTDDINLPIIESIENTIDGYFESEGSYSLGHVFQMTNDNWNTGELAWGGSDTSKAIDWMSRVIQAKGAWTWNVKRSFYPTMLHPEDVALLQQIHAGISSTESPTLSPSTSPTKSTTSSPTTSPTKSPTSSPTSSPTKSPTSSPTTSPTNSPTSLPTTSPTKLPITSPTKSPTSSPTTSPTKLLTSSPTSSPSKSPTSSPTSSPTKSPTSLPTTSPITLLTSSPTSSPTESLTSSPTTSPTESPTLPTSPPTTSPITLLTSSPTSSPNESPTSSPTTSPTESPTSPTSPPTTSPITLLTSFPTSNPNESPTSSPTTSPTESPTSSPTTSPTKSPTSQALCPNKLFYELALTIKTGPKGKLARFNVRRANKKQTEFKKVVFKKIALPRNDIATYTKCLKKNKCYQATFFYKGKTNKGIKKFTVTFGGELLETSFFKNMTKQVVKFGNCRK